MAIHEHNVNKNRTHPPSSRQNKGKYLGVILASVLSTLGLVAAGSWLYQRLQSQEATVPAETPVTTASPSISPAVVTPTPVAPTNSVSIQPGQFVQPALGNKALVELTAVRRIPGTPDEVSVEMRLSRVAEEGVGGSDIINVGSSTARNPVSNETYKAVDSLKRSSGTVSLFSMRRGEPVEGYAVFKVPVGVSNIDIYVDETQAFKSVPIADANASPVSGTAPSTAVPAAQAPISTTPAPQAPVGTAPSAQTSAVTSTAPLTTIGIQPGQFVQSAFGTKAQVELLSVKRIKDPELGTSDLVNVQMRIRRLSADQIGGSDIISVGNTTARNPQTSETYKASDFLNHSTGTVSLFQIRPQASADAYVWLRVPEGVNLLDIYVPDTAGFKNVPISN